MTPDLPFEILGQSSAGSGDPAGSEDYMPITAHYFQALRIPVMAGRSFRLSDTPERAGRHHQSAGGRHLFQGENPIGQHIRIGAIMGGLKTSVREIVGVVGDTKSSGLDAPPPGMMYLPHSANSGQHNAGGVGQMGVSWVVRTRAGKEDVVAAVRRIFMERRIHLCSAWRAMPEVISESVAQQRFTMTLLGCFGLISLFMGAAGLYGVMSYTVARRTQEIGLRMAVGADRGNILRMVLREAGLLVGLGVTVGLRRLARQRTTLA